MAHDPRLYHPKWNLIRRLVRRRAGNACEWCRAHDRQPHPKTGSMVYLATAHVDHRRGNDRFTNLAALCQRCHLAHDRPQHLHTRHAGTDAQQLRLDLPAGELAEAVAAGRAVLLPMLRYAVRLQARPVRRWPRPQLPLPYAAPPLLVVAALSPAELAQRRNCLLRQQKTPSQVAAGRALAAVA